MSAPRPIDIVPAARQGPSAADVAGRVAAADPAAQAQAAARLAYNQARHQLIESNGTTPSPATADVDVNSPTVAVKTSGLALVKSVPSADTLILVGSATAGAAGSPPQKTLILNGLVVPRLGRRKDAQDEPFAFAAKEFMRKLVIGKRIKFVVSYIHEQSGREYGSAELEGTGDLAEALVKAGWATVKVNPGKNKSNSAEKDSLLSLEEEARAGKLGKHNTTAQGQNIRTLNPLSDAKSAREFFEANKGKQLAGIVEQVREGSSLRIEIPDKKAKDHKMIMVHLTGTQCPRLPNTSARGPSASGEPYAIEAQQFTEARLLNRDVTVVIQGSDKFNNFFGTVSVPEGDIAIALLSQGLAKYIDWSGSLSSSKDELIKAEQTAKDRRVRLWKNFNDDDRASTTVGKEYSGKVISVVSGDTIVVEDNLKKESRVYLSSVKAPRMPFREKAGEPWAVEAKEWLRKKLIGKKVKVIVDYVRSAPAESKGQEERVFASVFQGKENIAESAVFLGLLTTLRHRPEEQRSPFYQALLSAEEKAAESKKGSFSSASPQSKDVTDMSERVRITKTNDADGALSQKELEMKVRSRQLLPSLQRAGKIKAVVEYVFNASRVKVFVPSENCVFALMLGGIRTPSGRGETPEPFANEATEFVRSRILQHDVEIEIESMDKGDNFLGSIFVERKNLSILLLERGLARVVPFSAEKSPHSQELFLSEKVAQASRLKIWKDWSPEIEQKQAEERQAKFKKTQNVEKDQDIAFKVQTLSVTICELFSPCQFYYRDQNDSNIAIVEAALSKLPTFQPNSSFQPKKGDYVLAEFSDGSWNRGKVLKNIPTYTSAPDQYEINFVDYGNVETVTNVRPVPEGPLKSVPQLAKCAALSGVCLSQDYLEEAAATFMRLVWDTTCTAQVDAVDQENHKAYVTLTAGKETKSINEILLSEGLVRVPSHPFRGVRKIADKFKAIEAASKLAHKGIWEYGDVSSDEDESNTKDKQRNRRFG